MNYLVMSKGAVLPPGGRIVADGEMIPFEGPWTFGSPVVVRLGDGPMDLAALRTALGPGINAFAVEGIADVGAGQAILVGGHMMRDREGFQPYAAAVPDTVKRYGGKFLVRGGMVTPIAGPFVPERVVLTEYATADDAVAWYTSDAYAPLLKIRLATTEARLVIMARSGAFPAKAKAVATEYLRGRS